MISFVSENRPLFCIVNLKGNVLLPLPTALCTATALQICLTMNGFGIQCHLPFFSTRFQLPGERLTRAATVSLEGCRQMVYPTESTLAFDNATGCEMDSVGRHKKSSLIYSSPILLEFTFHVNEKLMCETIAPDHFWVLKANRWMPFYMKPLF